MNTEKRRISFCPHCGNVAPQRLVYEHETTAKEIDAAGRVIEESQEAYYLLVCETCDQPLLYFYNGDEPDVEPYIPDYEEGEEVSEFFLAGRIWPHHAVPRGLPQQVRTCYQEALRLKPVSPNAFAIQIRRCLEALCDDRGASKGSLGKRLKELSFKGDIPPTLSQMTDVLRVLGNVGAHDFETKLSAYDAAVIDRFFSSVLEYVYLAPASVSAYRNSAKKFGKPVEEQNQGSAEQDESTTEKGVVH